MVAYRNPVAKPIHVLGWSRPVGNTDFRVVRGFGVPDPPRGPHNGIDLGDGLCGDPVLAGAPGTIEYANADPKSGGANIVIVNHGAERTWYAHLSIIRVRVGQAVTAGTIVGNVGATGWATGCHLHYQRQVWDLRARAWVDVDPAPILKFVEDPGPTPDVETDMLIATTIEPFVEAVHCVVPVGATLHLYDPLTSGKPAKVYSNTSDHDSGFLIDAYVTVAYPGTPSPPIPHGRFIRIHDGVNAGLLGLIPELSPMMQSSPSIEPTGDCGYTQADIDKAVTATAKSMAAAVIAAANAELAKHG